MSRPDFEAENIRLAIAADPTRMTQQLARELDVPEVEVVRALPGGRTVELDASRWEALLRALAEFGTVHVLVSNHAATLEATGTFGGFSTWGEFFNVQSGGLDLHLRWPQLASIFAVEKPSHMSGLTTLSFQFFDRAGDSALKVFLNFGGKAPPEKTARFISLREQFRRALPLEVE